jgi:hypothetical protein
MFVCGTGILPLIRLLKADFFAMEQPWHANGAAGAGRKFSEIRCLVLKLQEIGSRFGCFPEPPSKSILVVSQHNLEAAPSAFPDF